MCSNKIEKFIRDRWDIFIILIILFISYIIYIKDGWWIVLICFIAFIIYYYLVDQYIEDKIKDQKIAKSETLIKFKFDINKANQYHLEIITVTFIIAAISLSMLGENGFAYILFIIGGIFTIKSVASYNRAEKYAYWYEEKVKEKIK